MRRLSFIYSLLSLSVAFMCSGSLNTAQAAQPKEWTFLVFLNGNNSLDSFGPTNLKQMEKVGSTADINIVVQWASMSTHKVQRLLIQKSTGGSGVTSPVVQDLGSTDMGDWHSVVDFVRWGATNYPAKHYFLDIWDHGSGWHDKAGKFGPKDISLDENTGHMITTQELGQALTASAAAIGQKVDVYGSDACLMAMAEIANEMQDSVSIFAGSEDVEPGLGWPYDKFLARWALKGKASPAEVATMLSEEYAKSYTEKVTFSAFDLSKLPAFKASVKAFADGMKSMSSTTAKQVLAAAKKAQKFTNSDYADFQDFITNLNSSSITALDQPLVQTMTAATKSLIITTNNVKYPKATGLSIWLPQNASTLRQYASEYSQLKFDAETHWSDFLTSMLK